MLSEPLTYSKALSSQFINVYAKNSFLNELRLYCGLRRVYWIAYEIRYEGRDTNTCL